MTRWPFNPLQRTARVRDSLRFYFESKPHTGKIDSGSGYEGTFVTKPTSSFPGIGGAQWSILALRAASHQVVNGLAGWLVILQDGIHLPGDGHLDPARPGKAHRGMSRRYSLGDAAVHARN